MLTPTEILNGLGFKISGIECTKCEACQSCLICQSCDICQTCDRCDTCQNESDFDKHRWINPLFDPYEKEKLLRLDMIKVLAYLSKRI